MSYQKLFSILFTLALAAAVASGCSSKPRGASDEVQGVVLRVDTSHRMITLDHEKVPKMMEALVMSYPVDSSQFLKRVKEGDTVLFSLIKRDSSKISIATMRLLHPPKKAVALPKKR